MKLSKAELRILADDRSWERGVEYFEDGRVRSLVRDGETVVASVEGQQLYRVRLTLLEDRVLADCSCPIGRSGVFCKHCVAVGLAYMEDSEKGASSPVLRTDKDGLADHPLERFSSDLAHIREHLSRKKTSALVEMLIDWALSDEDLLRQLIMESASTETSVDTKTLKSAITSATRTGDFVHYRETAGFAQGIEVVVHSLGRLLENGFAEEAIPLVEYALRRVERAIEHMDDSDGHMRPILDDLQALHHAACVAAKPDPVKLARRIFQWEISGDWDIFYDAVRTYADVFGEVGLAEYRKLAVAEWDKVPFLGPGQEHESYANNRFRLTAIMKALAAESGDLEELITVMRRDLSSPYRYLEIAETYKRADALDQAVAWAESGVNAFPDGTDPRLRDFLAEEYRRLGREEEALDLVWRNFADRPHLEGYKQLKAQADRVDRWPEQREKALDDLRNRGRMVSRFRREIEWTSGPLRPHSTLVAVFLWENDADAAWEEARKNGCSIDQWLELARTREDRHPEDALRIRQDEVARLVNQTNNAAYREAIEQVKSIRRFLIKTEQDDRFREYVAELQREFKRKRNFMKLLDAFA